MKNEPSSCVRYVLLSGASVLALSTAMMAVATPSAAAPPATCLTNPPGAGLDSGAVANGEDSFACGQNATAQVEEATAIGSAATAQADSSTAVGFNAQATGTADLTAIGADSEAHGSRSTAVGHDAVAEGSSDNSAFGEGAAAQGDNNTALGQDSVASGDDNTAVGQGAEARGGAALGQVGNVSVGHSSFSSGSGNTALGEDSSAVGQFTTAVGHGATTDGVNDTALGAHATVTADHSTALGADSVADLPNQFVMGTSDETYKAPGITSGLSKSRQSGPLEVVTSDANGNLATDGGSIFRRLDNFDQDVDRLESGVAVAMASVGPDLTGAEKFGLSLNWGGFEGANAIGGGATAVVWRGNGSRLAVTGGIGVGLDGEDAVGGRAGGQWTW